MPTYVNIDDFDKINEESIQNALNNIGNLHFIEKGLIVRKTQYPVEDDGDNRRKVDLLCSNGNDIVLVELKAKKINSKDVGQLQGYISSFKDSYTFIKQSVRGIIIGRGILKSAIGAVNGSDCDIKLVDISKEGCFYTFYYFYLKMEQIKYNGYLYKVKDGIREIDALMDTILYKYEFLLKLD